MESVTQEFSRQRPSPRNPRERLIADLPVSERRLTLNGVATAVLEGGSGTPVLLLHGPGAYGAQWLHIIRALTPSNRVIAPDLPGHGASEFFAGALTAERVNGWLDDLIACTCSQPPVLIGHTLGGAIAARFACEKGFSLAALVLVDTLGLAAFQPAPAFGAALQAFLNAPSERTHDGLWSQCVFDLDRLRQKLDDEWQRIKAANLHRIGSRISMLTAWMEVFGGPAIPETLLARIDAPTTLIWGRHDRATALAVAESASRRYGWALEVIDDAADDPALEQPEAFVSAVRRTTPMIK
jgi:pimeloyl-ACP methyl ester carboxylesterase